MRLAGPWRMEFGPEGDDQQNRVVSNNSRELGSIQCASSKIISTGRCRTSTSIWRTSASMVFCFFCLALKFNGE